MQATKYFSSFLVMLVLSGVSIAVTQDELFAHKWYLGILDQEVLIMAKFVDQKPYLKFEPDNTFTGVVGCNHLAGTYSLTSPDGLELNVVIPSTASSTCQQEFIDLETKFITSLPRVKVVNITNNVLYFKSDIDNASSIAVFAPEEPY